MTDKDYDEQFKREVLPEWAERYDPSGTLELHRQLCTKDGRRLGNAFITKIGTTMSIADFKPEPCYTVLTDAGSQVRMIENEIHEYFYIGEYISKAYTIPGLRNRKTDE
jgi:hypothetical protein